MKNCQNEKPDSMKLIIENYLGALSIDRQRRINRIIDSATSNEERWMLIKSYFLKTSPHLVDNFFAWNLYKLTI